MTPISELEFIAIELMGPPNTSSGYWDCPFCGGTNSFHVLPSKGTLEIKFKCHRCGKFGDKHDLIKIYRPKLSPPEKTQLLKNLYEDYLRSNGRSEGSSPSLPPPWTWSRKENMWGTYQERIEAAYCEMNAYFRDYFEEPSSGNPKKLEGPVALIISGNVANDHEINLIDLWRYTAKRQHRKMIIQKAVKRMEERNAKLRLN